MAVQIVVGRLADHVVALARRHAVPVGLARAVEEVVAVRAERASGERGPAQDLAADLELLHLVLVGAVVVRAPVEDGERALGAAVADPQIRRPAIAARRHEGHIEIVDRQPVREDDAVSARGRRLRDHVLAAPNCGRQIAVRPLTTDQHIVACTAVERIGAAEALQDVITLTARQNVVPVVIALDDVVAFGDLARQEPVRDLVAFDHGAVLELNALDAALIVVVSRTVPDGVHQPQGVAGSLEGDDKVVRIARRTAEAGSFRGMTLDAKNVGILPALVVDHIAAVARAEHVAVRSVTADQDVVAPEPAERVVAGPAPHLIDTRCPGEGVISCRAEARDHGEELGAGDLSPVTERNHVHAMRAIHEAQEDLVRRAREGQEEFGALGGRPAHHEVSGRMAANLEPVRATDVADHVAPVATREEISVIAARKVGDIVVARAARDHVVARAAPDEVVAVRPLAVHQRPVEIGLGPDHAVGEGERRIERRRLGRRDDVELIPSFGEGQHNMPAFGGRTAHHDLGRGMIHQHDLGAVRTGLGHDPVETIAFSEDHARGRSHEDSVEPGARRHLLIRAERAGVDHVRGCEPRGRAGELRLHVREGKRGAIGEDEAFDLRRCRTEAAQHGDGLAGGAERDQKVVVDPGERDLVTG